MKKNEIHILATKLRGCDENSRCFPLMKAAADEIERLMAKIEKYAWHFPACPKNGEGRGICRCGYDKIYE